MADPALSCALRALVAHPCYLSTPACLHFPLLGTPPRRRAHCLSCPLPSHTALQEDRTMYQALECCAQDAIGPGGSWATQMDSGLVNNLGGNGRQRGQGVRAELLGRARMPAGRYRMHCLPRLGARRGGWGEAWL